MMLCMFFILLGFLIGVFGTHLFIYHVLKDVIDDEEDFL